MRKLLRTTGVLRSTVQGFALLLILHAASLVAFGQSLTESPAPQAQRSAVPDQANWDGVRSSLAVLIEEAERNNPQIIAAKHGWRAATQVPSQVSTLPDPQFTVQQFAVGSPRPFAGFTNSDFAYIGFGISQDLPYPGKLRLRGEAAQEDAEIERDRVEATRRLVIKQLKAAYFQLAYEHQELALLDRDAKLLDQVTKIAEANYRVGKGNQQDVLKAQLEQTKLLAETAMHHEEHRSLQARLKQLLNRPPDQPDIIPDDLTETSMHVSVDELLSGLRKQNPEIHGQQENPWTTRDGSRQELAIGDCSQGFLSGFQCSVHVATHGGAISRLLHADGRSTNSGPPKP